MRIVFLSYNYSPDVRSPEEWLERIKFYIGWSECLTKNHTVIRIDQIRYNGIFTHNGIRYHCIDSGKKKNYIPWKLHRMVRNLNPDVVVVSSFMFPIQMIQLRALLGKKVKIFVQHHAERPFSGIKKYIQKFASRQIDLYLFASSDTAAGWVCRGNLASENKIKEFPEVSSDFYPVDKATARAITGLTGCPAFIWVGRLNQNKNPLMAVKGFLRFADEHPQATLYMFYQTNEVLEELNGVLSRFGQNCPVFMVGKIPHADLLNWFNSAEYYISASYYEGSGTAVCEAMSCGCIPVVTDIPSFRTMVGNSGLLYEVGNELALLSALRQTVDPDINKKRAEVLHRFESEFSFNSIAIKFQGILDSF
jgi:glycosyltransferase involved in cell wall biosynthesis